MYEIDPDDGDDALGLKGLGTSNGSLEMDEASRRRFCLKMIGLVVFIFASMLSFLYLHDTESNAKQKVQPQALEVRTRESVEAGFAAYIQKFPEVEGDLETRGIETESD